MSAVRIEVRPGAYHDSIVLMELQAALARLPGVADSGAAMATPANLALLAEGGLLPDGPPAGAGPSDLVIAVQAEDDAAAEAALGEVDRLLERRRRSAAGWRPRSLAGALAHRPRASWVLVSTPGRWAARVAGEALDHGRHVFLYSDNVPLADEVALKRRAAAAGRLLLGPDCGSAIVGGVGFGFANRVRRGPVGIVAASGTGLQAVTVRLDALGVGVSHALGTGGRDLSAEVGGATAAAALDLLIRDPDTRAVVLLSKPPARAVAGRLLAAAGAAGKPVVVHFQGEAPPARRLGGLSFACDLDDAAELAAAAVSQPAAGQPTGLGDGGGGGERRWLRGLFSGGTLAAEVLRGLAPLIAPLAANLDHPGVERIAATEAAKHAVLDLGADELTVGRLHPMLDPELRVRLLERAAADPQVAMVLVDVVLGAGAHEDPAGALAPAIERAVAAGIEVAALLVGAEEDPQDRGEQARRLAAAGARLFDRAADLAAHAAARVAGAPEGGAPEAEAAAAPVELAALERPAAVNVGIESLHAALLAQGAESVDVDWRPPAGGDRRLVAILDRMKGPAEGRRTKGGDG